MKSKQILGFSNYRIYADGRVWSYSFKGRFLRPVGGCVTLWDSGTCVVISVRRLKEKAFGLKLPMPKLPSGVKIRQCQKFPDYWICSNGQVWTTKYQHKKRGCFLQDSLHVGRYLVVWLYQNKVAHRRFIHHLVLETFVGPCLDGMQCCHWDGNFKNNNLKNLRWDTPKANHADKIRHGTVKRGRENARTNTKLTEAEVRNIRILLSKNKFTLREIGERFGVSLQCIYYIKTRKTWLWLE